MDEISISSTTNEEVINITQHVQDIVSKSKIRNGICIAQVLHTSAAIYVNESWDPGIGKDVLRSLSIMVPKNAGYEHDKVDGNADAHIKATLLGSSVNLIISDGKLVLGKWQGIMLCELDGPRDRTIAVQLVDKQA